MANAVDEIKLKANIVDVINRVVPLKKKGGNYWGLCPFHHEKTPSFSVNEDKQIFHCFGCSESGDVITFVQKYYHLDFQGAVLKLAEEYNVDLSSAGFGKESRYEGLYAQNREAAAFFYKALRVPGNPGYAYMHKRGIDDDTLKKFGIGYADDQWQSLTNHFASLGADLDELVDLSVLSRSDKKESDGRYRIYDRFRSRVMFPIINTRGKVIGFGGRVLTDEKPKYLNSSENAIFQKKDNLYGLNLTRTEISREDCAIVVEGYMDVISLYQAGVRNVCASLGTALTENQAKLLYRYTHNVVLCYDADGAGLTATMRGLDIMHAAGFKVKAFHVTDGKDPDEFIKLNGREAYLDLVKNAMPFADYKIDRLRRELDLNTTEGNVEFLKRAAAVLRQLSPVEADVYTRKIAQEYHVSEGALRREVEQGQGKESSRRAQPEPVPEPAETAPEERQIFPTQTAGDVAVQRNLIRLMLEKSTYVEKAKPYEDVFTDPACYRIYRAIVQTYHPPEELDLQLLADSLDPASQRVLTDIREHVRPAGRDEELFDGCIRSWQKGRNAKRKQEIISLLQVLDDTENAKEIEQLTRELIEIQKKQF